MKSKPRRTTRRKRAAETARWSNAELDHLIWETTADCNDLSERASNFCAAIDDAVAFPFESEVLGVPVLVVSVELTEQDEVVAICCKERRRQRVSLFDLSLPSPPPAGAEWIAAYRRWAELPGVR